MSNETAQVESVEQASDEVSMQTMQRANELSKQYEEIKDRTVDDNTVLGEVVDIDTSPANDNISVDIDLPAEDQPKTYRFKKPKVWSESYHFVRWIQYYDYDADSFPRMLKDHCKVEIERGEGDEYSLFVPSSSSFVGKATTEWREVFSEVKRRLGWAKFEYFHSRAWGTFISFYLLFGHVIIGIGLIADLIAINFADPSTAGLWTIVLIVIFAFNFVEDGIKDKDKK